MNKEININITYSTDEFLGGRLLLKQSTEGARVTSDTMLLAAAVPVKNGNNILDAGTGNGAAALAVATRVPNINICGIDLDEMNISYANYNAKFNNLEEISNFVKMDISDLSSKSIKKLNIPFPFDHVLMNPPYYESGKVQLPSNYKNQIAKVSPKGTSTIWIDKLSKVLVEKGTITIINRMSALDELLIALNKSFGGINILPIMSKITSSASRVIVQAKKGSRSELKLLPPLILHENDGSYTKKVEYVLRNGATIDLSKSNYIIVK